MSYVIVIYREHDADTSVNGPYEDKATAILARGYLARQIAERRPVQQTIGLRGGDWDDEVIVYDSTYEETEPTDDDWHVTLRVDFLGEPVAPGRLDAKRDALHDALVDKDELEPDSR